MESRRVKYLRINLTQEMKDLYDENYSKSCSKELKNIHVNGKILHIRGLKNLILLMLILPKAAYSLNIISIIINLIRD